MELFRLKKKFTDRLWEKITPIYEQILHHPFIRELAEGTLCQEKFNFYMQQDAFYLVEFSKTLALIAGRSTSVEMVNHFLMFSTNALNAERSLHQRFLEGVRDNGAISPACLAYTNYLIATASKASLEESMAAVLPCFWIYREIGQHIKNKSQNDNPYKLWIELYSSECFSKEVDLIISITNKNVNHASVKLMELAFKNSALLEWQFWDDAYYLKCINNNFKKIDFNY